MADDEIPLLERVANYYSQLTTVAADLNAVSDELGKSIAEIDVALKKLNLGITAWVPVYSGEGGLHGDDFSFWSRDIGYAKVSGKWGISLRTVDGNYHDPDEANVEAWLFNDAPRSNRLEAIGKIPELLEKLSKDAVETTKNIQARLGEAKAVADAVKSAASNPPRIALRIPTRALTATIKNADVSEAPLLHSPFAKSVDLIRKAIAKALISSGHVSAAQILGAATWFLEGASIRIEVAGMSKKMLSFTVNAAAENIVRQELQRLGAPTRFMVVPVPGQTMVLNIPAVAVADDSTEAK